MEKALPLLLLAFFVLVMIWLAWCIYQNEQTYKDRMRILNSVRANSGDSDFWRVYADYEKVDYDEHARARELLRDPWALYSPLIRKKVGVEA